MKLQAIFPSPVTVGTSKNATSSPTYSNLVYIDGDSEERDGDWV